MAETGAGVRRRLRLPPSYALPSVAWFATFLFVPLVIISVYSFAKKGVYGGVVYEFSLANYWRATDWIYLRVLWNSLYLGTLTTLSCWVLGFPLAYVMATSGPRAKTGLMVGLMIPFWTNFVIRAFSIKFFFGDAGPVNELLQRIGWTTEPVAFANSDLTVWFGMVTNYLPFMVLPLYVVMEKLDFAVLEAARDLGASSLQVFWKVLVPLARKGTIAGITLVFPCALGEFVIPDLLGGAKTMLIGNLITDQFLKTRDWPFGASISVILFGVVLGALALQMRTEKSRE